MRGLYLCLDLQISDLLLLQLRVLRDLLALGLQITDATAKRVCALPPMCQHTHTHTQHGGEVGSLSVSSESVSVSVS